MSGGNNAVLPVGQTERSDSFKPLKEVCVFIRGVSFDTGDVSPTHAKDMVPVLRAGNIQKTIIYDQDLIWIPAGKVSADQWLRMGDILICMSSGSSSVVGKTCRVEKEWRGTVGAFCGIIRPLDENDSEYLALWFRSSLFTAWRDATARGANIQNLRFPDMANLEVPWPSPAERIKIAEMLREQLAEVELARKAVEDQLRRAEALPGAFFKHVFSSSALQQWPGVPLGECCDLLPSKSICLNGDTEVQAITSACLTEWGFTEKGIKASRMWAKDVPLAVAQAGEILISRSNTPELVGRVSIFPGTSLPVVASDLTIRIMPKPFVSSAFIAAYLSHIFISGFWKHRAGGASGTMKKITRRQIENLILHLPALPEQNKHVMTLNAELQGARLLRASIEQKLSNIEKLPAALLREAFTGAT